MRGVALVAAFAASVPAFAAGTPHMTINHSRFELTLADGRVAAQAELAGAVLTLGDGSGATRQIRIDAVTPDPMDASGELMLYTMSEQAEPNGEWRNICEPDREGRRAGFPIAGSFSSDMRHLDAPGRLALSCTGGAEAKCIRFGYKPWGQAPDGTSLAPYYQTCLRLVRADYCGDGVGHTRNGTPIDIFDRVGVQRDETAPGMTFEAAFAPDGAVCVAHPRLPDEASLPRLTELCPKLSGRTGPSCDDSAKALLFVRSFGR